MHDLKDKTIKELAKDCRTVEDVHEMLKNLFKDTIQQLFEAEMDDDLGYSKHSSDGDNTGNSRNGYSKKTIKTKFGNTELNVPRDRNSESEPQIVKKHETSVNGCICQLKIRPHNHLNSGHAVQKIWLHVAQANCCFCSHSLVSFMR